MATKPARKRAKSTRAQTSAAAKDNGASTAQWESLQLYRKVFEEGPLGMAVAGLDFRLVEVNQRLCEMLGYTRKELTALSFPDFIHPEDVNIDVELAAQLSRGEIPRYQIEERFIRKNGETIWVQLTVSVLHDEDGNPKYGLGMVEDITERKQAEEALRESEERFRSLADTVPAGIVVWQGTTIRYANPGVEALTGYSPEELEGMDLTRLIHPDYLHLWADREARITSGTELRNPIRWKLLRRDGGESWCESSATVIDLEGEPAVLSITLDISERVRAEEALRESEERFRKLVETAGAAIMIAANRGKIKYANPAAERLTGRTLSELQAMEISDIVHAEDRAYVLDRVSRRLQGEQIKSPSRQRIMQTNGDERWVETSATLIDFEGEPAVLGILLDITDRVRAEEALRESEKRFRSMAETAPALITIMQGTAIRYASPGVQAMTGYSPEEFQKLDPTQIVHPDDVDAVMERNVRRVAGEEITIPHRYRAITKDGEERWVETSATLTEFDDEPAILGVTLDVTELVRAEEELRESEKRLRFIFEAGFEGLLIHDNNGVILDGNPAIAQMSGYQLSELAGMRVYDLVAEESRELIMQRLREPTMEVFEAVALKKDGTRIYVEIIGTREHIYKGQPVSIAAVRDITERKRLEEKLQQAREALEGRVEQQMLQRNQYGLTFREFTVLHHVAAGEADKEIALELGISPLTVHKHVANILGKMSATSRTEAAARALREGLLD